MPHTRWSRLLAARGLPGLPSLPAIPVRPLGMEELAPMPPSDETNDPEVPLGLRLVAGWTWRVMVCCAGIYLLWLVLGRLSEVVVPLCLAILFTAALWPVKAVLQKVVPRALAVALCLLLLVGLVVGIFALVGTQIASQSNSLAEAAVASYQQLMTWLGDGPLHLHQTQIDTWTQQATDWLRNQQSAAADYAATVGTQLGRFFAGLVLTLFTLFFLLYEGDTMARGLVQLAPRGTKSRFRHASQQGWLALVSYVRAAIVVAAVDGLGAGIGAACVGSNLFLAIGSLTFISAFVPLIGAVLSGMVATSVVLLTLGWVRAVIMLVVFIVVIQVEAHVLQPFLLGKAVSIHPLLVLYGIAIGTILGGIIGALFAMPLMAFGNAFARALTASGGTQAPVPDPQALPLVADEEVPAGQRTGSSLAPMPADGGATSTSGTGSATSPEQPGAVQPPNQA